MFLSFCNVELYSVFSLHLNYIGKKSSSISLIYTKQIVSKTCCKLDTWEKLLYLQTTCIDPTNSIFFKSYSKKYSRLWNLHTTYRLVFSARFLCKPFIVIYSWPVKTSFLLNCLPICYKRSHYILCKDFKKAPVFSKKRLYNYINLVGNDYWHSFQMNLP